ncbi:enoyl-CoA hydratase [Plastoroseomonas arctica]|uniref:Enoyl-CoA hydratase domain-containing protein 3, mitochondrial n=1 Tax=Plastoroseomonas arctica TaxID=1509237 RepID=A0AAF1KPA8_9PROT|nr:enoyl-CoA hydratase [Plastoroseomonas arctica]MBR0657239.1 enoyl-CoA hydratase [Plastoroseomonas arctica]
MADGMPHAPLVTRADSDAVVTLTLNRAAARNALSRAMMATLRSALEDIAAEASLRVIVLAAEGPVFCAGHDLREITAHRTDTDGGAGFFAATMADCGALMQAIVHHRLPVIAAVEHVATAAGCQLVASCDLAVAGAGARFCTPGVDIGLFCSTPAVALARAVPRKAAMEMLLTGAMIDAGEALRIGLVNRVVREGAALEEAVDLARGIAERSAVAVQMGKRAFNAQIDAPLAEAYRVASATMVENLLAADAAEGIGAFLEKRPPRWQHR